MSAVPKRKLCWHCDGSVAQHEVNTCPYCGVYLLATEDTEENRWNPNFQQQEEQEVPSPLYQIQPDDHSDSQTASSKFNLATSEACQKLKLDVGPILMLMSGSIFFLFAIVLYLFAQDGLLTLQWNAAYWPYFLGCSFPLIFLGWRWLEQIEEPSEPI